MFLNLIFAILTSWCRQAHSGWAKNKSGKGRRHISRSHRNPSYAAFFGIFFFFFWMEVSKGALDNISHQLFSSPSRGLQGEDVTPLPSLLLLILLVGRHPALQTHH